MAVNRHKPHLIVLPEDDAYLTLVNGIKHKALQTNAGVIDVKRPCGGWLKVFKALQSNLHLLQKPNAHLLLLIDYDDPHPSSQTNYQARIEKLNNELPQSLVDRVFILGVNYKEAEVLKEYFEIADLEIIGKLLVEDCPSSKLLNWHNIHLHHNISEIQRMQDLGVFEWLFN